MSEELKERIHDLLKINVEHQNINAELRKDEVFRERGLSFMKSSVSS